jgi:predicted membrane-bound mannosyltransferase
MVLPALVMVAFLGLWIVNLGISEFTLQTQVSQIARSLARGEKAQPEIDKAKSSGVTLEISNDSDYVSVTGSRGIRIPLPNMDKELMLHASSTARDESLISE